MLWVSRLFFVLLWLRISSANQVDLVNPKTQSKIGPKKLGCPLDVYLLDKWGDGWNGAKFATKTKTTHHVTGMNGGPKSVKTYSPKPKTGGQLLNLVLSTHEPTTLSITTKDGNNPKEYWEIWWSFTVEEKTYIGGYNTEITLRCLWESPISYVIQVIDVQGPTEPTCNNCPFRKGFSPKISAGNGVTWYDGIWIDNLPPPTSIPSSDNDNIKSKSKSTKKSTSGSTSKSVLEKGQKPSDAPSIPTLMPTKYLTKPSKAPVTPSPTVIPSPIPTESPTVRPTSEPSASPSSQPSSTPSIKPTFTSKPTGVPSGKPTTLLSVREAAAEKDRNINSKPKPKPKPQPYILTSTSGLGWFESSGAGTHYSISDYTRTDLISYGSICDQTAENLCEEQLPDGEYIFRVGGNGATNKAATYWEFCGIYGTYQQELKFVIDKGLCISGDLRSVSDKPTNVLEIQSEEEDGKNDDGVNDDVLPIVEQEEEPLVAVHLQPASSSRNFEAIPMAFVVTSSIFGGLLLGVIATVAVIVRVRQNTKESGFERVNTEEESQSPPTQAPLSDEAMKILSENGLVNTVLPEEALGLTRHRLLTSIDL